MSYLVCGTGAIGNALTRLLVQQGKRVIGAGRNAEKLNAMTPSQSIVCDFSKTSEVATIMSPELPKDLTGLAYCVGSAPLKPLRSASVPDMMEAFSLNAVSAVEVVRAAMPTLKKNRGSIVLFSSVAVQHGFNNHVIIGAAKGAVEGITRNLAADLSSSGVRVNCIAPSLTANAAITASLTANEKIAASIAAAHPLGRLGAPEDSAALAAFLLSSDDSSWITGQVFACDGGRSSILR
uniref:Uncharacterized protein n=1 Tax=Aureoumbra lagunensis TaxID=44058 RepID=A0A7S3JXL9_9STRA